VGLSRSARKSAVPYLRAGRACLLRAVGSCGVWGIDRRATLPLIKWANWRSPKCKRII
jgi:hypothetical protein